MKIPVSLAAIVSIVAGLSAAPQPAAPYTTVEVDRFVAAPGVIFPADSQSALADDIAREISVAFPTIVILHPGETPPAPQAVLRISGVVTRVRHFGTRAPVVEAQVWLIDNATSQVLLNRALRGFTQSGGDSLAKKIVKLCRAGRLLESN